MDIGKAIGFMFEDEEWIGKLLLGAVIMLIPVFGQFALMGYSIAIIRNVKADRPRPLPAWSGLGEYFVDGLKVWAVTLIYAIPIFVLICPITLVGVLPALGADNEDLVAMLAGISGIVSVGLSCLIVLYGILLSLLKPVLQMCYAETGEIGLCLRFGEMFRLLFANIGNIVVAQLVRWAAGMIVMSIAGALTFGLLVLPASVWLTTLSSHMYGQIGRQAGMTPSAV